MRKNGVPLTRDQVLQAALKILDDQGVAGLSMRKLAAALDVEAMSLYNHVRDKRDLLDGVADLVLAQIELPDPSLPWDRRIETIASSLYAALLRHPTLVIVFASEQGMPRHLQVLQGIDSLVAALGESGLPPQQQVSAYRGLLSMCFGFVLAHTLGLTSTRQQAQAVWDQWDSAQWNSETLPHLARLAPYFLQTRAEDDFQFMLNGFLEHLRGAAETKPQPQSQTN